MSQETTKPRTVETAAGPILQPVPYINLIKEGPHRATVTSIDVRDNRNGNPYIGLDCDLGNRTHMHQMYITINAFANTAEQLKTAFDIDIEAVRVAAVANEYTEKHLIEEIKKAVQPVTGKNCSLNFKHEIYNGKPQAKVAYVNPDKSTDISEKSVSGLLSKEYQPKAPKPETPTTLDILF